MANFPEILDSYLETHKETYFKTPKIVWVDGKAVLKEA
jgi:hypothetical protein